LGHVISPGKQVNYDRGVPNGPSKKCYNAMPRFMANNSGRNAVNDISAKTLADVSSENWVFFEPESSFKLVSNSEISQKTAELKQIMQERNQLAATKKLEGLEKGK